MIKLITHNLKQKFKSKKGIALYIAVTVTAALILVSFSVVSLALKQISISGAGRDSQEAFYAADSGVECAIFWDVKNSVVPGQSAFTTTTPQVIFCNSDLNNPLNGALLVGGPMTMTEPGANGTSTFSLTFLPQLYCAQVTVVKGYSGGLQTTKIESRGYNTCDTTSPRRVERAILTTY